MYIEYRLMTVTWVKNCRSKKGIKQCLGGLKCSQNTKKNKKTLKVRFKAIFNVRFANCCMNNCLASWVVLFSGS